MTKEELKEFARVAQALNPGELTEAIGYAMIQEGMATIADRSGYSRVAVAHQKIAAEHWRKAAEFTD